MEIISTKQLNDSRAEAIISLVEKASLIDGIEYEAIVDTEADSESELYVLAYDKLELIGYLNVFFGVPSELAGLIHPDYRRKGIMMSLYEAVRESLDSRFELSGHDDFPGFKEFARKLNCEDSYHEYLMEYDHDFSAEFEPVEFETEATEDNAEDFTFKDETGRIIGHIGLAHEGSLVNIFNVYVEPEYRNMGNGRRMLLTMLNEVDDGDSIVLQVSEKNQAALRLYLKCGFNIISSVLYYCNHVE